MTKMGIFGGLQRGIVGTLLLFSLVEEVGLVGGHLKTSSFLLSLSSFPFFLFLFFFYINFGPAGPFGKRERERVGCGVDSSLLLRGAWSFSPSIPLDLFVPSVKRERGRREKG